MGKDTFRGGWPALMGLSEDGEETFLLSDESEVEGEKDALKAQDDLPWPRPFRSPRGGFATSDRYRFVGDDAEKRAKARQKKLDKESK